MTTCEVERTILNLLLVPSHLTTVLLDDSVVPSILITFWVNLVGSTS